jgi:hypothetical protein
VHLVLSMQQKPDIAVASCTYVHAAKTISVTNSQLCNISCVPNIIGLCPGLPNNICAVRMSGSSKLSGRANARVCQQLFDHYYVRVSPNYQRSKRNIIPLPALAETKLRVGTACMALLLYFVQRFVGTRLNYFYFLRVRKVGWVMSGSSKHIMLCPGLPNYQQLLCPGRLILSDYVRVCQIIGRPCPGTK